MKQSEIDEAIAWLGRWGPHTPIISERLVRHLRALKPDPEPRETCATLANFCEKFGFDGFNRHLMCAKILRRLDEFMRIGGSDLLMQDVRAILLRGDPRV